jgi:cold shock protein
MFYREEIPFCPSRLSGLNEGQKIAYEIVADKRTGKSSADNLKPG